ncbi:type II secretion system minor pseudopilin GspH [Succinimonas sp.]|uniref:type II secretion system minor pseudopilin GspH n=1 Tax=Succinimonas sp. TaxID=1936151 RepID=UPI0038674E6D
MYKLGGFTLLEVLMVLLIMGLMVSVATSALPGGGTLEGTADEQADKLILIMEEISDRAAMEGRIIGLHVNPTGYSFMMQVRTNARKTSNLSLKDELMRTYWDQLSWVQYDAEDVAVKKDFDEGVTVALEVGGLAVETADSLAESKLESVDFKADARDVKKRELPQILFYPTGEVTPFRLNFLVTDGSVDPHSPVMIIGEELGNFRRFDPETDRL